MSDDPQVMNVDFGDSLQELLGAIGGHTRDIPSLPALPGDENDVDDLIIN